MEIVIPVATFALLLRYLIETGEPRRTKYIVGGLVGASFFVVPFVPFGFYVGMLLQLGISVYILIYLDVIKLGK